jgi:excisionase family DNA binding protein
MADTTTTLTWLTMAEAAARMNVSARTVARRVANGQLRTQRTPDGRVLVAVEVADMAGEGLAVAAVAAQAEGNRQAALALGEALGALQRTYEAAHAAVEAKAAALSDRAAAAERSAYWWRVACLSACLPTVMAVAVLTLRTSDHGQPADTVSATPLPPVAAKVPAPVAVEADPDGWHPPLQP